MVKFILFAGLGRLLIFTIQKHPLARILREKHWLLDELIECEFCLGFWVYLVLSFLVRPEFFGEYIQYVPVITEILEGIVVSFLVHIFSVGWRDKFSIIVIGEEHANGKSTA